MITALAAAAILGQSATAPKSLHDFTVEDIKGKPFALKQFKGKVVMVVNTASRCGLTPQYEGLQNLYNELKDKGFVVIAFPANNFNGQEPGSNEEILTFCKTNYSVSFPLMSKISVKDKDIHPLYTWLIANSDRPNDAIEWNFAKFIVDKKGQVAARFTPRERPESPFIRRKLDELLAQ